MRRRYPPPCSYDWVDDAGRPSPTRLLDLPDPRPGDPFTTAAGRRQVGRVVSTDPGRHLTASLLGVLMPYVLSPQGDETRLLLELVVPHRRWYGRALPLGDWLVARRQLLDLEHLAETSPPSRHRAQAPDATPRRAAPDQAPGEPSSGAVVPAVRGGRAGHPACG